MIRSQRSTRPRGNSYSVLATLGLLCLLAALPLWSSCVPTGLPDSSSSDASTTDADDTSGGVFDLLPVLNQTGRPLTSAELDELVANSNRDGNITIVFLNPLGRNGQTPKEPNAPSSTPVVTDTQGTTGPQGGPVVDPGVPPPPAALIGEVRMWTGSPSAVPSGWRACDGAALSRTQFPGLFGVLGTRYGAGDGTTTFTLPDFRNRSPMGSDAAGSTGTLTTSVSGSPLAEGGSATHTLTAAEMPAHDHDITHTHNLTGVLAGTVGSSIVQFADPAGTTITLSTGAASPTRSNIVGGGTAHNNLHPYFAILYIIHTGEPPP